jgi:uncharacterized protein (TIGR02391 family)
VRDRYGSDPWIIILAEVIQTVEYPLDLSHLYVRCGRRGSGELRVVLELLAGFHREETDHMARRSTSKPELRPANLTTQQMKEAIPRLARRLQELEAVRIDRWDDQTQTDLDALQRKIEETLVDIFGADTIEYKRYQVGEFWLFVSSGLYGASSYEMVEGYQRAITDAAAKLRTAIEMFQEKLDVLGETREGQALRAYQGLELHPEIARTVDKLYRDGHYANAVEDAVKALNQLVRLRSVVDDLDGTKLMEHVFSPNKPVLRFNALADESDRNEQKGYMMFFSGAVAGLRNPRAHKLIQDDAERALEFIAFISLLAKLLDGAEKG